MKINFWFVTSALCLLSANGFSGEFSAPNNATDNFFTNAVSMVDNVSPNGTKYKVVVESTTVFKSQDVEKNSRISSRTVPKISAYAVEQPYAVKRFFASDALHSVLLKALTGSAVLSASFYSKTGEKVNEVFLNSLQAAPNKQYFAVALGGVCTLDPRGLDSGERYLALYDITGQLLWKRLRNESGDPLARIGRYYVSMWLRIIVSLLE